MHWSSCWPRWLEPVHLRILDGPVFNRWSVSIYLRRRPGVCQNAPGGSASDPWGELLSLRWANLDLTRQIAYRLLVLRSDVALN